MDADSTVTDYLAFQEGEYCAIDEMLDIRDKHGKIQILVCWKGFGDDEPTWTPF